MRYFIMKQDQHLSYSFKLRDFDMNGKHQVFHKEEANQLNDTSFLYVVGKGDEAYSDFIQNPVYMASEVVQGVLDMYEDELISKKVVIIHKETQREEIYYHIITDHIEALSEKALFYPDGLEKKIILDREKIGDHHVFQLKDVKGVYLIVSLAVVESLLRRQVQGILFEEVEVV
nr:DUF1629 domain-containing protein [uncultured Cellulosilyticum sp.]